MGKRVASIGRAANIIVDPAKNKTASAHDLRRSFGDRWKILPQVTLQTLMRHADVKTTQKYYTQEKVAQDSKIIKKAVANFGAILGATPESESGETL